MNILKASASILLFLVPASCAVAQDIMKSPAALETLDERWNWAAAEAAKAQFKHGGWVAYSIDRLMGEDSWVGSFRTYSGKDDVSLHELITGIYIEDPSESIRHAAKKALSRSERKKNERKVKKEVALLFRFSGPPSDEIRIQEIHPTNLNLAADLEGLPLLWLGKATTEESLELLKGFFHASTTVKQKRNLIMSYGMHDSPRAFDLLKKVAEGDEQADVRKDAVFWIGQQNSTEALRFLESIVRKKEESRKVAEQAIFAISQIHTDEATDLLIDLGKNGPHRELRKKAVFWLGQQASKKVVETLKDFAYDGEDVELQKQAVFALTQLDNDEGVTEIIRIAKTHSNPAVRKQAIFWLGQSEDPRAFDTIVEIAKGK